jgi:hypothetical protein
MMASPIMVASDDRAGRPSVKLSFRMFAGREASCSPVPCWLRTKLGIPGHGGEVARSEDERLTIGSRHLAEHILDGKLQPFDPSGFRTATMRSTSIDCGTIR